MLKLEYKVPQTLILPEQIDNLPMHLKSQNAHWFSAQPPFMSFSAGEKNAVAALHSKTTEARMQPTIPNKQNSTCEGDALVFQEATHCGFMLPDFKLDTASWSAAVRFRAPLNSARTLITLNPYDAENYVFLHQVDGQVIFKDQKSTRELTAETARNEGTQLIVVGMSEDRLWMRVNGNETLQSDPARFALDGQVTLFLGCRSNRPRLLKTLGSFRLLDLVCWPDRNILAHNDPLLLDALVSEPLWRPPHEL